MGTEYTSVRLTEEAHELLKRRKREDETYSEVIERLASERSLTELSGLFDDEEVEDIREARRESYGSYTDRRERGRDDS